MKNPIGITNIGDPFILNHNGVYYLYATTFEMNCEGFFVWESEDLKNWSKPEICYEKSEESFGYKDFWAPEVVEHNGKFIMHYSARDKATDSLKIGVAVSDSPRGRFIDVTPNKPMFDLGYSCIDGHVLKDGEKNYFYYSRDCSENIVKGKHESHIYVVELSADLSETVGSHKFLFAPSRPYETCSASIFGVNDFYWNEGPFVVKRNGKYFMMYSANFFASRDYCICLAESNSPLGEFKKAEEPLATFIEGKVSGPGHNCVFQGNDGKLYCAYHAHTNYSAPNHDRQLFIDEIKFENNKVIFNVSA